MLEAFEKHQDIWNDCYLGYVIIPNKSKVEGYAGISLEASENKGSEFYPWLIVAGVQSRSTVKTTFYVLLIKKK